MGKQERRPQPVRQRSLDDPINKTSGVKVNPNVVIQEKDTANYMTTDKAGLAYKAYTRRDSPKYRQVLENEKAGLGKTMPGSWNATGAKNEDDDPYAKKNYGKSKSMANAQLKTDRKSVV